MQSGRHVVDSAKESAANVAASARSGMEKTKATVQEKVENLTAGDPIEHRMAKERKKERIAQAELAKLEAREQNAAAKLAGNTGTAHPGYTATGEAGHIPGAHQMSGLPGHGTGQPVGQVTEGVVGAHPIGTDAGTQRSSAAHNTRAGSAGAA